jgi:hypothetical protein
VPVPVHVPVRFAADEAGGGVAPVGAEGAEAGEPQPASEMSSAAVASGAGSSHDYSIFRVRFEQDL